MRKYSSYFKILIVIAIIVTAILPAAVPGSIKSISAREKIKNIYSDKLKEDEEDLPVVGSYENLKKLLEEYETNNIYSIKYGMLRAGTTSDVNKAAESKNDSLDFSQGDYSTTNVQVQGVDESDVIKTDGEYIYHVNSGRIIIMKAYPAEEMKIASIINYSDNKFTPFEIYVDKKYLVVIGNYYYEEEYTVKDSVKNSNGISPLDKVQGKYIYPPRYTRNMVKAIVYDIESKKTPKLLREIEIEGEYVSSRKIGTNIYFVTNKYLNYYMFNNENSQENEEYLVPLYRDSKTGSSYERVDYSKINYFPGIVEPNYMIIAGLNIENLSESLNLKTYLGSCQNIYVSEDNLYAAAINYEKSNENEAEVSIVGNEKAVIRFIPEAGNAKTVIYRFSLKDGIKYSGNGEVPGKILNQFSMDENGEYFRIATTKGESWRTDENTSKNNLYVLDKDMKIAGKIEDIAPGEIIYSVRFMGDRAYMVTFRTVDPLFVIDLNDPKNPKILGKLKIPGYSNYIHPYDENHIIGFGKDTVEVANKDANGNVISTNAYYLGMKIAVFDVSDVNNPVEEFKTTIGGRGTDSELLYNHRALLFSREKNLLAFPVTVLETEGNSNTGMVPEYGKFIFQGAYVYNIDIESGFTLKGKISHLTADDYMKSGDYWYDENGKNVQRVLYIGDVLYTISNNKLMAHDIGTISKIGEIQIPVK